MSLLRFRAGANLTLLALALCVTACGDEADASGHSHDGSHSHGDGGHSHDTVDAGPRDNTNPPPDGSVIGAFQWELPETFPRPPVPLDNPMSIEKVALGRHLFYDKRLSGNETQSCATCHKQERAFADERTVGLGSTGELHTRSSMSLANVGYSPTLTWANPIMLQLERQVQVPLFGDRPIELGMHSIAQVEERLRAVPRYRELFAAAYPGEPEPITMVNAQRAIATFERTLVSGDSAFDRYLAGDASALSESALRGMRFVTSNEDHRFECNHCHGGFTFSDHTVYEGSLEVASNPPFHQTGLYDLDGSGLYPAPNTGIHDVTQRPEDMGKFKAPTLRNVAITAPYMHDGSIATLSEVLDHYAKGGRARNAARTDQFVQPFEINAQEKADIIAFLEALTDQTFVTNPKYSDPWPAPQ
ncbi:MAG: MbnH family di-heme enzyme [Polyangiales bacterium]